MNVPKLRFGEFKSSWKFMKLGQLGNTIAGLTYSPKDIRDSGLLVLRSSNVKDGQIDLGDCVYVDTNVKGAKISQENDILICVRNGSTSLIGKNALIPAGIPHCTHGAFMTVFRAEQPKFIHQLFQTTNYKTQVSADLGARINSINNSQLIKYQFAVPPTECEQQKIADFLSAVDDKITALTAQKTALTQYKQGMMQRIFSQTLRFKDDNGADYPEWDSMRLKELGEFKSGVGFPENEQGGQDGVPFFKVSDMNLSENTFHMTIANHYVNEEQIQKLKLKIIKNDAVVFAKVGAAIFLERKRIAKNFLIDNNMMAFIPKTNILFMKYLFETVQLSKFAQVGALPSYNSSDLGVIKVGLPNSYEEQTKIAQFLTELDNKINAVDAQIQSAQQWKQGLLQQMFV